MKEKYGALRIIILLYNIAAGIVLIGGIILGIFNILTSTHQFNFVTLEMETVPMNFGPGLGLIFSSVVIAVSLLAVGQLIQVFLDMESNTRQQARGIAALVRQGTLRSTDLPKTPMRKLMSTPDRLLDIEDEFPNLEGM